MPSVTMISGNVRIFATGRIVALTTPKISATTRKGSRSPLKVTPGTSWGRHPQRARIDEQSDEKSHEAPRSVRIYCRPVLRRSHVKRILFALIALAGATSYAQQPVPEIPFDSVPSFLKLPADMNFGEVSGIAVNSKGEIAVYTRSNSAGGPAYAATASQLLLFDKTGRFLREVGKGLYA